jgi:hypothetical protein
MFCGNVAKAKEQEKNKEGRHVGLDFYDLLIGELNFRSVSNASDVN